MGRTDKLVALLNQAAEARKKAERLLQEGPVTRHLAGEWGRAIDDAFHELEATQRTIERERAAAILERRARFEDQRAKEASFPANRRECEFMARLYRQAARMVRGEGEGVQLAEVADESE